MGASIALADMTSRNVTIDNALQERASEVECSMELNALRNEIDAIDKQIATLLDARAAVVKNIAALKKRTGTAVHDATREQKVLDSVASLVQSMPEDDIRAIYRLIMDLSKRMQG